MSVRRRGVLRAAWHVNNTPLIAKRMVTGCTFGAVDIARVVRRKNPTMLVQQLTRGTRTVTSVQRRSMHVVAQPCEDVRQAGVTAFAITPVMEGHIFAFSIGVALFFHPGLRGRDRTAKLEHPQCPHNSGISQRVVDQAVAFR